MADQSFKKVWTTPLILGALTLFGLLAALLGTGIWYGLAWIALSIPVVMIVWKIWRSKPRG